MACFGACAGAWSRRRDTFHTPTPFWGRVRRGGGGAADGEWTPTRSGGGAADGYASPLAAGSAASSVRSFYSAVSAYTDAADDVDGAESGAVRSALRNLLPQAPASVRRFLRFDAADADAASSQVSEGTVISATPTADQVIGGPAMAVTADDDDAVSIGPPSSQGRGETLDAAVTAPSASAVPSHPLNVDDDDEGGEEEVQGGVTVVDGAGGAPPPPALIPALIQAAGSAEAPTPPPVADLQISPVRAEASAKAAGALASDAPAPSLWGRVFGGGVPKAPVVAAEAPASPAKPAPLSSAPVAEHVVTEMTAAGPAGSAAATEAVHRRRLFGW